MYQVKKRPLPYQVKKCPLPYLPHLYIRTKYYYNKSRKVNGDVSYVYVKRLIIRYEYITFKICC